MATKKNRIMITISDEGLRRLESVREKYGIGKSVQIQCLIMKYLETEYGKIEKGDSNDTGATR